MDFDLVYKIPHTVFYSSVCHLSGRSAIISLL